jgi:hypothetical protein
MGGAYKETITEEDAMNSQTATKFEELTELEPELIDVDMPFDAKEVEAATSRRYVAQLTRSDMGIVRCSKTDRSRTAFRNIRAAVPTEHVFDPIDVDMPFSSAEVSMLTSEAYVAALGSSDMPVAGRWGR